MIQMVETLLEDQGYQILHIAENKLAHVRKGQALKNHFGNRSITGWLLCSATESTQRLAQELGVSAFVVGTAYPGIHLPSIDLQFDTVGTHAALQLLRRGHSRFLTVSPTYRGLGDQLTIDAFQTEVTRALPQGEASITSIWLRHPKDSFVTDLVRAFRREQKPTAIFSTSRGASLTAFTWLLSTGHRIPADVSFLNRDYSSTLARCVPSLGGYFVDPRTHSRRIARTAAQFFAAGHVKTQQNRLFPEFRPGETLAQAAQHKSQFASDRKKQD
jgi:DNA-binding LacI/PurR family transcriptional regulator